MQTTESKWNRPIHINVTIKNRATRKKRSIRGNRTVEEAKNKPSTVNRFIITIICFYCISFSCASFYVRCCYQSTWQPKKWTWLFLLHTLCIGQKCQNGNFRQQLLFDSRKQIKYKKKKVRSVRWTEVEHIIEWIVGIKANKWDLNA